MPEACFVAEKPWEVVCRPITSSFWILFICSIIFLSSTAFFSGQYFWRCPVCSDNSGDKPETSVVSSAAFDNVTTSISHVVFGISGSASTWHHRREYVELWWRPNETRGCVWMDEDPPGGRMKWLPNLPPYRISEDASRFGPRASAARIARIVSEAYRVVAAGEGEEEEVRWLVMGDDDTVFFTENLVTVLGKYDHRQAYYIGGVSESVEQDVMHSYGMAFGGGGFAVSLPAAAQLSRVLDRCLQRYTYFYGSDERVHACLTELGVPLTVESGFHQVDIRGDPYGLLAAHPLAPLVTVHHLDHVDPISPRSRTRVEALRSLVQASRSDPARILQQAVCYEENLNWSVSVSWGYTVQIYPWILTPKDLVTPLQTFLTWRSFRNGPFTFNTRPWSPDPCKRPLVFFLDRVLRDKKEGGGGTVTEYSRYVRTPEKEKSCDRPDFDATSRVGTVRVFASKMQPDDWKKAPRRHCCESSHHRTWWGSNSVEIRIRKCRLGETLSPP